jgi:hypothetical protein
VIMPRATRRRVARALAMLRGKQVEMPGWKHDNLPLQQAFLPSRACEAKGSLGRLEGITNEIVSNRRHPPRNVDRYGKMHRW